MFATMVSHQRPNYTQPDAKPLKGQYTHESVCNLPQSVPGAEVNAQCLHYNRLSIMNPAC
jgi:hypothetical protein